MRDCCSRTIHLAMVKRPTSSDLEADDIPFLMICAMARTGPLWKGIGTSSESMTWELERLQALIKLS